MIEALSIIIGLVWFIIVIVAVGNELRQRKINEHTRHTRNDIG